MGPKKQLHKVLKKETGNEYLVKTAICQTVTEITAPLAKKVL